MLRTLGDGLCHKHDKSNHILFVLSYLSYEKYGRPNQGFDSYRIMARIMRAYKLEESLLSLIKNLGKSYEPNLLDFLADLSQASMNNALLVMY